LRGSEAILPDPFSSQSTEKTINLVWGGKALSISSIQFLSLKESEAIFPDPIEGSQALQIRSQVKKKRGAASLAQGRRLSAPRRERSIEGVVPRPLRFERGLAPGALSPGLAHLQHLAPRTTRSRASCARSRSAIVGSPQRLLSFPIGLAQLFAPRPPINWITRSLLDRYSR
jgi:hypothetical protein